MKPARSALPLAPTAAAICTAVTLCSCQQHPPAQPAQAEVQPPPPAAVEPPIDPAQLAMLDSLAKGVIQASPATTDHSPGARDVAAITLARFGELVDASADPILWGTFDSAARIDPAKNRHIVLSPEIWSSVYLSCFQFTGAHTTRRDGEHLVLEIPAQLRAGLTLEDYPYPIWHSPAVWNAWHQTGSIIFVIKDRAIVASYLKTAADTRPIEPLPVWEGRWTWTAANGSPQPRVSQVAYGLAPENPHIRTLDRSYRQLSGIFESRGCMECHSPANPESARRLFLLAYPNHAVAAREPLLAALADDAPRMPEGIKCTIGSLRTDPDAPLIKAAATTFLDEADAAFAYETIYIERPEERLPLHPK